MSMGERRTLTELLHVAAGLIGTAIAARIAAWAVPQVGQTIWQVAFVAMAAVAAMGVGPLRAAWRTDRAGER